MDRSQPQPILNSKKQRPVSSNKRTMLQGKRPQSATSNNKKQQSNSAVRNSPPIAAKPKRQ